MVESYQNQEDRKAEISRDYMKQSVHNQQNHRSYPYVSILNRNELNAPIKRRSVDKWIPKHNSSVCCLSETLLKMHVNGKPGVEERHTMEMSCSGYIK